MTKKILIIGGNGRIGKEITAHLYKQNNEIIVADIKKNKISKEIKYVYLNLADTENLNKNLKKIFIKNKGINNIINCAYPTRKNWGLKFEKINNKNLIESFNDQLFSNILLMQFLYYLSSNSKINAILISSIQGVSAPKFNHYSNLNMTSPLEYSLIKSSIIMLTKYLAKYSKGKNLRINCISPGGILDNQNSKFKSRYKKDCISKGLLDPKDLLSAFDYLLNDNSSYVNGQNIIVDDGWSL